MRRRQGGNGISRRSWWFWIKTFDGGDGDVNGGDGGGGGDDGGDDGGDGGDDGDDGGDDGDDDDGRETSFMFHPFHSWL